MQRQIAIVEDEAAIRHNYEDALRRYNYRVNGFADRISALEAFRRRLPDLVIITDCFIAVMCCKSHCPYRFGLRGLMPLDLV